ncbi:MAG: toxin [Chloroflexi bacterium]|nr:toxin [Chloroflexota bacterium]
MLLSRDDSYELRRRATIAEVSTRIRGIAVEVMLGPEDGLPRRSAANLDNINTVDTALLKERVGLLSPSKIRAVDAALKFALGIPG